MRVFILRATGIIKRYLKWMELIGLEINRDGMDKFTIVASKSDLGKLGIEFSDMISGELDKDDLDVLVDEIVMMIGDTFNFFPENNARLAVLFEPTTLIVNNVGEDAMKIILGVGENMLADEFAKRGIQVPEIEGDLEESEVFYENKGDLYGSYTFDNEDFDVVYKFDDIEHVIAISGYIRDEFGFSEEALYHYDGAYYVHVGYNVEEVTRALSEVSLMEIEDGLRADFQEAIERVEDDEDIFVDAHGNTISVTQATEEFEAFLKESLATGDVELMIEAPDLRKHFVESLGEVSSIFSEYGSASDITKYVLAEYGNKIYGEGVFTKFYESF